MSSPRNPELVSAPSTASRASAGRHAWAVDCAGHPALSSFDAARRARQCRSSRSEPPRFASRRARPPTENGHEAKTATMRLRSRRLLAAALICAASLAALPVEASSRAQRPLAQRAATSAPRAARLDRALRRFARAHPAFPGVAVAVDAPGLAWSGAAGAAELASRSPLAPDATFRIASVTKTFTAAAVLRLMEDGKLGLDDPIAKHLSAATIALVRRGGYDIGALRVRHLLQHTSGLYDYAEDPAFQASVVAARDTAGLEPNRCASP